MSTHRQQFSYHPEHDADVARWIAEQANASAAIRNAIRLAMRVERGEMLDAPTVRAIVREELRAVQVVSTTETDSPSDVDAELAADIAGAW